MLKEDLECEDTEKVTYTSVHELASISVCSNVSEYSETMCFVMEKEGDQSNLAKEALEYLRKISTKSSSLLHETYADYISQIQTPALRNKFENYLMQIPVISFNGAKYDLKIMREHLVPILTEILNVMI